MELVDFIQANKDWEKILSAEPYNLKIKKKDKLYLFAYNMIKADFSLSLVRESRGVILHIEDDSVIPVCVPFFKFFNANESLADEIDWSSAMVTEKLDGSIMKLWYYDDSWRISTNGMIDANECGLGVNIEGIETFGDLFRLAFNFDQVGDLEKDFTYMFELTSPLNRVVVPHRETIAWLIGCRNNITLKEVDIFTDGTILPNVPRPKVYSLKSYEEIKTACEALPFNEEGYVVVDKDFHRTKNKSLAYLKVHRLKGENNSFTARRIFDIVRAGEQEEVLAYFPEWTSGFDKIQTLWENYIEDMNRYSVMFTTATDRPRAEVAREITSVVPAKFRKYIFASLDGKSIPDLVAKVKVEDILERL